MKKQSRMKEYLKMGLATIVPIALLYQVSIWIYNISKNLIESILPDSAWYIPILGILGIFVIIIALGMTFQHLRIARWFKKVIETHIIDNIPIVRNIYNFGKEVSDTFIADVKDDGDMTIVEVYMGPITMMGVLTDAKNGLVFVVSAPSPLTGFVMKTDNYKVLDMTFMDLVQINTSLGRINGNKWK